MEKLQKNSAWFMVKPELKQLNLLDMDYNIANIQAQSQNLSEKDFENYLVNFFCYDKERIIAGFSRFGKVYTAYARNKNQIRNREEKRREFKNFVKARDYIVELLKTAKAS